MRQATQWILLEEIGSNRADGEPYFGYPIKRVAFDAARGVESWCSESGEFRYERDWWGAERIYKRPRPAAL